MRKQFIESAILSEEDYKREANKREPRKLIRVGTRAGKQFAVDVFAKDYKRLSSAQEDIVNAGRHSIENALQWQLSAYLESKMRPGLTFDEARTEAKQREELARVGDGEVRIEKGDSILKKTQIVRPATIEKLRQEYRAVKTGLSVVDRVKRVVGLATLGGRNSACLLHRRRSNRAGDLGTQARSCHARTIQPRRDWRCAADWPSPVGVSPARRSSLSV